MIKDEPVRLKKKKIIFFIPTLAGGGAERVMSELSLNFPGTIEQFIVLFENRVSYSHRAKIIFLSVDARENQNLFLKLFEILRRIYRFRKVVIDCDPDVVISFLQANMINVLVKFLLPHRKYKAIISERTATSRTDFVMKGFYGFVNRLTMRFVYRRAEAVVAVSQQIKNELISMFGIVAGRIRVIYNPVDSDKIMRFAQQPLEHPWFKQEVPIIINVGRFAEQKNQRGLLLAFARIYEQKRCRLLILGDGVLKDELWQLSQKLGVEKDVQFLEYQHNPFVYIARSMIFCLSSGFEGFPNVLVEAMAVGCSVIAFDCLSGPREILAPALPLSEKIRGVLKTDCGLLIENANLQALGDGIQMLLNDTALRKAYCRAGQQRVKDFSVQRTIDAYLDVCDLNKKKE